MSFLNLHPCRDDSAEVDVYDPQKNDWNQISPMNQVGLFPSVSKQRPA